MGSASKKARRKALAIEQRKAKRARTAKALESLKAYSLPTKALADFDRNLARARKPRDGQLNALRQDAGEAAVSEKEEASAPTRRLEDVCDLDEVVVPSPGSGRRAEADSAASTGQGVQRGRRGRTGKDSRRASHATAGPRAAALPAAPSIAERVAAVAPPPASEPPVPHEEEEDKLVEPEAPTPESELARRASTVKSGDFVVRVSRTEEIAKCRLQLPICAMEQEIMEAVNYNSVVLVCGETGSGKTTQIPQFLYEAGYGTTRTRGQVGVTQPRRIAASSTAERVAQELGSRLGDLVGYQVRHDRKLGSGTAVKFMTDGILMRELQEDALLRKYSVIVLDEVHERNLNTDVILGFLTRIIPLRTRLALDPKSGVEELKLLIMSATLSSKEFVENRRLFKDPPPVVSVPAKRYPVTVHFSRRTEMHSYLDAAYRKIAAIHRKLPNGGILAFVTGQREVMYLAKRLRRNLCKGEAAAPAESGRREREFDPFDGDAAEDFSSEESDSSDIEGDGGGEDGQSGGEESDSDLEELPGTLTGPGEAPREEEGGVKLDAVIVPLYAKLGHEAQTRAFSRPPPNCRQIVIATNVAETSITIPGIRYVVDTGRSKQKTVKSVDSGLSQFEVDWISKSSATQRAGRAGRTGPGHCYRLFSSAFYNDTFPQHSLPDISNTPLESVVLQLKSIGVDKSQGFPFPTQPNPQSLSRAERCLKLLGAVDAETGHITPLGGYLAKFPVNPRHARMIVASVAMCESRKLLSKCLRAAIAAAAILSFENPVAHQRSDADGGGLVAKAPTDGETESAVEEDDSLSKGSLMALSQRHGSDVFAIMAVLRAYEEEAEERPLGLRAFCQRRGLHSTVMRDIVQLKRQLAHICVARAAGGEEGGLREHSAMAEAVSAAGGAEGLLGPTPKPHSQVCASLRYAICVGWADRVARRLQHQKRYRTVFGNAAAASSARFRPEFVVYKDLVSTAKGKVRMETVTEVRPSWVTEVLRPVCAHSAALEDPPPSFDPKTDTPMCWVSPTIGDWVLPPCMVEAKDKAMRCRAFLSALLSGRAYPDRSKEFSRFFGKGVDYVVVASSNQPGVVLALQTLERYNVCTRKGLARACCLKKGFLLEELGRCARKGSREDFAAFWTAFAGRL